MVSLAFLQIFVFSVAAAAAAAAAPAAPAAAGARCFPIRRRRSTVVSACCSLCCWLVSPSFDVFVLCLSCIIIGITCRLSNFVATSTSLHFIGDLRPFLCVPPVLAGSGRIAYFLGFPKGPRPCVYMPLWLKLDYQ